MEAGFTRYSFVTFTPSGNTALFDDYLRIKYDVFIDECAWNKIPHEKTTRKALADPYDAESKFCAVIDEVDGMVGIVRGTLPPRLADMHRAKVYADFGKLDFVKALDGRIGTINAMAVRPKHRWGNFVTTERLPGSVHGTGLSDILMRNIIVELGGVGTEVILLSAVYKPAYSLMRRIGFKMINPPDIQYPQDYSTDSGAPPLTLCDMAIITRDAELEHRKGTVTSSLDSEQQQELIRLRNHLKRVDDVHRIK